MIRCVAVTALLATGCVGEDPAIGQVESTAAPLGMFSTASPRDARDQAWQALRQDAHRRESRFSDAADPGYLFRATRVEAHEIGRQQWSPDDLFQIGGQLFTLTFTRDVGFGAADLPPMARLHRGRRGGPDATRCAACHWRGGLAGAGDAADNALLRGDGVHEATTTPRNPPALAGAGLVELVAREMSAELQSMQAEAVGFAQREGYAVRIELRAKGVSFGTLAADPDGGIDTSGVVGVDADLVVKPFGWKGTFPTIRDIVEDALLVHHGMQSEYLVANAAPERIGFGPADDPDGDGVTDEVSEGQVSALTLFIAMQDTPQEVLPDAPNMVTMYAQGRQQFDELGCAACHTASLTLDEATFALEDRAGTWQDYEVDLLTEAAEPRLSRSSSGELVVRLFSDLRRHRMGPGLAEQAQEGGAAPDTFVTPPLWGLARSRPYLHDGRAPTIEDAILLHGGEAQSSRDAFAALDEYGRAPLRVFLTSLTRADRLVTP